MQDEITLLEQVHACNQGEKSSIIINSEEFTSAWRFLKRDISVLVITSLVWLSFQSQHALSDSVIW